MQLPAPIQPEELRIAMRRWATGVTVVATVHSGVRHGMTASSFTSLSLEPPYVMVSLELGTRTHDLVEHAGIFGVTILALDQVEISQRFAYSKTEQGDRFEGVETFELSTGAPFVRGGLAYFDCRVVKTMDAGTHTVYVGEVVAVLEGDGEPPLVYYAQQYRALRPD